MCFALNRGFVDEDGFRSVRKLNQEVGRRMAARNENPGRYARIVQAAGTCPAREALRESFESMRVRCISGH